MQKKSNTGSPTVSSGSQDDSFHTLVPLSRPPSQVGSFHTVRDQFDVYQQTLYQKKTRQQQQLDKKYKQYKARRIIDREQEQFLKQVDDYLVKQRKQETERQQREKQLLKQLDDYLVKQRKQETERQVEKKTKQIKNKFGWDYIQDPDAQKDLSYMNKMMKKLS